LLRSKSRFRNLRGGCKEQRKGNFTCSQDLKDWKGDEGNKIIVGKSGSKSNLERKSTANHRGGLDLRYYEPLAIKKEKDGQEGPSGAKIRGAIFKEEGGI